MTSITRVSILISCLYLLAISLLEACQVPVFRYALERWSADKYELAVFSNGQITKAQQLLIEEVGNDVNLEVAVIDIGKMTESDHARYGNVEVSEGDLVGHLYYPWSVGKANPSLNTDDPLWNGNLTKESLNQIVSSPVRKSILEKIISGESAVWVLIETGDEAKDNEAENKLWKHLNEVSKLIEIPDGVVGPGELDRVATGEVDVEDVLRSTIPLKISFDVIRIKKNDPKEKIFLKMLTSFVPQLIEQSSNEPLIFPVFGRGRTLEGLPSSIMSKRLMMEACSYLCGACSCEVKRENPGIDLVLNTNWKELLVGSEVIVDKVLPPLEGVGDLVGADSRFPDFASVPPPDPSTPSVSGSLGSISEDEITSDQIDSIVESEIGQSSFNRFIGIGCALVLGALVIFTAYIKKNS
ncbi:MAG: hypothetical protein VYC09_05085 [Verrucomicrobiota bacterium]|nr:hypothetical protein [Verrucomicrobiota bacterium]